VKAASAIGDAAVRTALLEAAHIMLTKPRKAARRLIWAMPIAGRAGMRKVKAALTRKLAVILRRTLANATVFNGEAKPMTEA